VNVVISEVLSHTDPPLEDAIELCNLSSEPVDIGNWWLSDSAATPRKYRIPAGTVIQAHGYRVFYQYQFAAEPNGFSLSSTEGESVYLSAADAAGTLTGGQTSIQFGALKNGVSAGRYATSAGVEFVPLSGRTFGIDTPATLAHFRKGTGTVNAVPRIGPLVISEIMFAPADQSGTSNSDSEFIEIHNPTTYAVPLYDPLYPTNTWRVRDGVSFDFPQSTSLPANTYLLLVSFSPTAEPSKLAAFRSLYSVPEDVPIIGPYEGRLSDTGEGLRLLWPDEPQGLDKPDAGFVPYEQIERIDYQNSTPWPTNPERSGYSCIAGFWRRMATNPQTGLRPFQLSGRPASLDTDVDGMPDSWETAYGPIRLRVDATQILMVTVPPTSPSTRPGRIPVT
jgi:hypothetical protein